MKNATVLIILLTLVVAGSGGFFAGMKYQQSKQPGLTREPGSEAVMKMRGQDSDEVNRIGARPVSGEILDMDDQSLTVEMGDGSSKIIFVSEMTQINQAQEIPREELTLGKQVSVFGNENADGSITATNIQVDPIQELVRDPARGMMMDREIE
jgi:hypothetical protein